MSPARSLVRDQNSSLQEWDRTRPFWALVVCPSRRKPGAGQPEQYALIHGSSQISPHCRPAVVRAAHRVSDHRARRTVKFVVMIGPSSTYKAWKSISERPGGTLLFSAAAVARVAYFASILPHVVRMEPGLAEVKVPKWPFVHNHLHTVHAIASCNAAEMAMGMLIEAP
jgi:Domain of unknown function (DUF4442)